VEQKHGKNGIFLKKSYQEKPLFTDFELSGCGTPPFLTFLLRVKIF
jgi:hypothetical protein